MSIKDKLTELARIVLGVILALGLLYGAYVAFSGGAALDPDNIRAAFSQDETTMTDAQIAEARGNSQLVCLEGSTHPTPECADLLQSTEHAN